MMAQHLHIIQCSLSSNAEMQGDEKQMKHALLKSITCAGLLLFSFGAAQAAAQSQDDDSWYRTRDQFYAGDWRMHMFERIKVDLDHVQDVAFNRRDEDRIVNTKERIADLQDKMVAGRYDGPELDDVVASLDRVVSDNRLSSRDREMLRDDLSRVRDYRDHHDNWH
jgi:hypothetical protein